MQERVDEVCKHAGGVDTNLHSGTHRAKKARRQASARWWSGLRRVRTLTSSMMIWCVMCASRIIATRSRQEGVSPRSRRSCSSGSLDGRPAPPSRGSLSPSGCAMAGRSKPQIDSRHETFAIWHTRKLLSLFETTKHYLIMLSVLYTSSQRVR